MARARWAEDLVARWYEHEGYVIVARNWRCREGELDIIAIIQSTINNMVATTIAIVEVKARASRDFGAPFEAVTFVKQKKIRTATRKWLATQTTLRGQVRFDVAGVLGVQIEVIFGAF